ncbi:MAG TPA: hypothetical protein VFE72_00170 [Lysobacter sp.]|nr:hypothetical protein [Lysobacter sp.]
MTTDLASTVRAAAPVAVAARVLPFNPSNRARERDFGVGYGRSSGYAAPRSYTANTGGARFRVA